MNASVSSSSSKPRKKHNLQYSRPDGKAFSSLRRTHSSEYNGNYTESGLANIRKMQFGVIPEEDEQDNNFNSGRPGQSVTRLDPSDDSQKELLIKARMSTLDEIRGKRDSDFGVSKNKNSEFHKFSQNTTANQDKKVDLSSFKSMKCNI